MSLRYEPASEPLHISVKLFSNCSRYYHARLLEGVDFFRSALDF